MIDVEIYCFHLDELRDRAVDMGPMMMFPFFRRLVFAEG
jgi:hypothetical protein